MLSNMKIGPRLMLAFLALVAIGVVVGGVGLLGASKINDKADDLYNLELMGLSHIKEANINLIAVGRARANFLLATSEADRDKQLAAVRKGMLDTQAAVEKARPLFVSERAKEIFASYERTWSEYDAELQRAMTMAAKQQLLTRDEVLTQSLNLVRDKADALDAMMNARIYRPGRSLESALEELRNKAGTQFWRMAWSPAKAQIRCCRRGPPISTLSS